MGGGVQPVGVLALGIVSLQSPGLRGSVTALPGLAPQPSGARGIYFLRPTGQRSPVEVCLYGFWGIVQRGGGEILVCATHLVRDGATSGGSLAPLAIL